MCKLSMALVGALCLFVLLATSAYGQETVTLTVNSAYGLPDPPVGVNTVPKGVEMTASVPTPVDGGPGVQYACVGWKAKGDPEHLPSVGFLPSVTFTPMANAVLTWKWKAQYLLTLNVSPEAHCVPGHIDYWSEDQPGEPSGTYPPDPCSWWSYKRVAQLHAVEHEGYDFAYWTGGSLAVRMDPTANPTAQQMRRPEGITAVFVAEPRTFTVGSAQGLPHTKVIDVYGVPVLDVDGVGIYALHYDDQIDANCGPDPYPSPDGEGGVRYVCIGNLGTGDVEPLDRGLTSILFTLHQNSSVEWQWKTQYYYDVTSALDCLTDDSNSPDWYDAGTGLKSALTPEGVRGFYPPLPPGAFTEDFEAGFQAGWTFGSTGANWYIVDSQYDRDMAMWKSGTHSARSGAITHSGSTWMQRVVDIPAGGGSVSFWWSNDSENGYDFVKFWVDGVMKASQSGPGYGSSGGSDGGPAHEWVFNTFTLTAGPHTLKWEYMKDSSYTELPDCAWVDDIQWTILADPLGYRDFCVGYTGTGVGVPPEGPGPEVSFVIQSPSTITWNWEHQWQLTVGINPAGSGQVLDQATGLPALQWYKEETVVSLFADRAPAYIFDSWSGDLTGTENPQPIEMTAKRSVTANFVRPTITVINPRGAGDPVTNPDNHHGEGIYTYDRGTEVTCSVTTPWVTAPTQYFCTGYTGTGDLYPGAEASSVTFTITQHSSITWNWFVQHKLFITNNPATKGGVTPVPDLPWYDEGSSVELTASPVTGWLFNNWTGDVPSPPNTANPITITMNSPKYITANYIVTRWNIVVAVECDQSSWIYPTPGQGTNTYDYGTSLTVKCEDRPVVWGQYAYNTETWQQAYLSRYLCTGYKNATGDIADLYGAEGTATSLGPFMVTTQHSAITWTWKTQYPVIASVTPTSPVVGGTVTTPPIEAGQYGNDEPERWVEKAPLTTMFTAVPEAGFGFSSWSGSYSGTDNPAYFSGIGPADSYATIARIVANFYILDPVTVTIHSEHGNPSPPKGDTIYRRNYELTLSVPFPTYEGDSRYYCTGWTSEKGPDIARSGEGNSMTFTITGDTEVTWLWRAEYMLRMAKAPSRYSPSYSYDPGSFSPLSGNWYQPGETQECTATANAGWIWDGWTGSYTGMDNPYTITMDSQKSLTANFRRPTLQVVNPLGAGGRPAPSPGYYPPLTTTDVYSTTWTTVTPLGASVTCSVASPAFEIVTPGSTLNETFSTPPMSQYWGTYGHANWYLPVSPPGWSFEGFEGTPPDLVGWTVSAGWAQYSSDKHSGTYCAHDYNTTASSTHSLSRDVTIGAGGGSVTFWWKTTCSYSGTRSRLAFLVDGGTITYIYYNTAWTSYTYPLTAGTHTLRWDLIRYSSTSSSYHIHGFVDDISITNPDPGGAALGYAESGDIADSYVAYEYTESCLVRTVVIGDAGGTINFKWSVSSENNYDWLEFYLDDVRMNRITGTVVWGTQGFALSAGVHTLKWRYMKDAITSTGSDCGRLDDVVITNLANSGENYTCTGYTGTGNLAPGGAGTSVTSPITQHSSITWNWSLAQYMLTYSANPPSGGTVGVSPSSGTGYYDSGTYVTLTAYPNSGIVFAGWTGDVVSTASSIVVLMDGPKNEVANFVVADYPYSLAGVGASSSSITWSWLFYATNPALPWVFELRDSAEALKGSVVYPTISCLETGLALENTLYTRHVHAIYAPYDNASANASAYTLVHDATTGDFTLSVVGPVSPAITSTIGSGNSSARFPIDISYNYARCQFLLYASELGTGSQPARIYNLRFQRDAGSEDTVDNVDIRMAHTDAIEHSSWVDTSTHTVVYSGNLTIPNDAGGTWFEIPIVPAFSYDGVRNLIISVRHQDGMKEVGYTTWRCTLWSTAEGCYRCVAYYDDVENPPTVQGGPQQYYPNTQLDLALGGGIRLIASLPLNPGFGLTGVRMERDTDEFFSNPTLVRNYSTTYNWRDVPPAAGTYWYRIRFRNAAGIESAYSAGNSITVSGP